MKVRNSYLLEEKFVNNPKVSREEDESRFSKAFFLNVMSSLILRYKKWLVIVIFHAINFEISTSP